MRNINLFVWNTDMADKIAVSVLPASEEDFLKNSHWQTNWTSAAATRMPNKVALRRADNGELLGLMSYELDQGALAVEIIYIESAAHSNTNLLSASGQKRNILGSQGR